MSSDEQAYLSLGEGATGYSQDDLVLDSVVSAAYEDAFPQPSVGPN